MTLACQPLLKVSLLACANGPLGGGGHSQGQMPKFSRSQTNHPGFLPRLSTVCQLSQRRWLYRTPQQKSLHLSPAKSHNVIGTSGILGGRGVYVDLAAAASPLSDSSRVILQPDLQLNTLSAFSKSACENSSSRRISRPGTLQRLTRPDALPGLRLRPYRTC